MLGAGGKLKFKVKIGNPRTAAYKCRQYFSLNPVVKPKEFSVRVGLDCQDLGNDEIQIVKLAGSDFGVEFVEEGEEG